MKHRSVSKMILLVMRKHLLLVTGIVISVCGAILLSLVPPMILARIIDALTTQKMTGFGGILAYFGMLALTGLMESTREGLLIVFGQKMTHALRSGLMEKLVHLKADDLNKQEPGAVVSRFVGDVDTVENLFTSGIVSMFADACKIHYFTDPVTVPVCVYPLRAEEYAGFTAAEPESGQPCVGTRSGNPAQHPDHSLSFQGKLYGTEV